MYLVEKFQLHILNVTMRIKMHEIRNAILIINFLNNILIQFTLRAC